MFRVAELWRYPVKSLGGERLEASRIGAFGLTGDRAFGILDVTTGTILTARREPRLLLAAASWHDGEVAIAAQGEVLDSDEALSAWLDRPVRLVRAGSRGGTYENPEDPEGESGWIAWQGPGHAWHDSGRIRVSLVSRRTVGNWETERFRSNVVLADGEGEDALVGRQVRVGSVVLDVTTRIDRCVMVTRAQPGIAVDKDVLRTIHRERGGCLAIGALVAAAGEVAVGDGLVERTGSAV